MSSSKKCIVPIVQDTSPSRTVSFNELTGGKERVRMSLSVEELALLDEIQRRGRINSSTSNKDRHNLVPSIIETTNHGISVDPATLLDVAGWKIPPLPPGLVSITHEADRHPYPSALPTCIFEKAMKAAAIVHAGSQLSPLSARHNTSGSGNGVAANGNTIQLAPLDLIRLLPPLSPMYPLISDGMQRPATPASLGHGISAHGLGPQRQGNEEEISALAGPAIAQLVERRTVECKLISLGRWFESGWLESAQFLTLTCCNYCCPCISTVKSVLSMSTE
ncbi:hypothetical protein WUBG_03399 [Wuchereria bancrofti]|uniref:Uncharacterized protein n=1 Tax=Wuchereria bancrofti TaxID=6293 RepID=J9F832_WUCBA|nr:hypothetical protein WUBG_03399 [Wuchereria bancrofti]